IRGKRFGHGLEPGRDQGLHPGLPAARFRDRFRLAPREPTGRLAHATPGRCEDLQCLSFHLVPDGARTPSRSSLRSNETAHSCGHDAKPRNFSFGPDPSRAGRSIVYTCVSFLDRTIVEPSDAELIARVRGGDTDAYGDLFERHREAAT